MSQLKITMINYGASDVRSPQHHLSLRLRASAFIF